MARVTFDRDTPPVLRKELRAIIGKVGALGIRLPPIVVRTDCSHARTARNYAAIMADTRPVELYLCEDLAEQPITRVRGILWHEVGHVLDELNIWSPTWDCTAAVASWQGSDSEQRADFLVAHCCGVCIYYDDDLVQRAGPGARGTWPRPRGLR
jgi:hypothetical protein